MYFAAKLSTRKDILLKDVKFCWVQIRKVILLIYQNNYVERPNSRLAKFFAVSLFLRFQQNYFDGPTKLFSDLYPAKF